MTYLSVDEQDAAIRRLFPDFRLTAHADWIGVWEGPLRPASKTTIRIGTRSSRVCGRICDAMVGPLPQGRWVCENNPDLPWLGDHARCGAGAPAVTSRMADIT